MDCGTTELLEFDHDDAASKSYSVAKILAGGSAAKVAAEVAKCVLRCVPCHKEKSRRAGDYRRNHIPR